MEHYEPYEPRVIPHREFREIAVDFANPLDAIREAISNSLDAQAQNIRILATCEEIDYQKKLVLTFLDDGIGMTIDRMHAFFDLGNSKWDQGIPTFGRKGHGTKIFYRSERIELETINSNRERILAIVDKPWIQMQKKEVPLVRINGPFPCGEEYRQGTTVRVIGFFDNKASFFEHDKMKDYIRWFTAWGSVKPIFSPEDKTRCLEIQGVDRNESELISFCEALSCYQRPIEGKVGIITCSGGHGALAVDACSSHGLSIPILTEQDQIEIRKKVSDRLQEIASFNNPIDLTGSAVDDDFVAVAKYLSRRPDMDCVLMLLLPYVPGITSDLGARLSLLCSEVGKPLIAYVPHVEKYRMFIEGFQFNQVPVAHSIEEAVHMVEAIRRRQPC